MTSGKPDESEGIPSPRRATERGVIPSGRRVSGEGNLGYAALHPFAVPGWDPPDRIQVIGSNWQVVFNPENASYVEATRGGTLEDRTLPGPCVFIATTGGFSDPGEVVTKHGPIVEIVRGLLLMAGPPGSPILLPPVWEGVFKKTTPEKITYEDRWSEVRAEQPCPAAGLREWGERWRTVDIEAIPPEITFALRWYAKAMMEMLTPPHSQTDAFISFWLCIIAVVRAWHARTIGGNPTERERFEAYATCRLQLTGQDLSQALVRFKAVNLRRNELFKGGGGMIVSDIELDGAAVLAHQVLDHDMSALR